MNEQLANIPPQIQEKLLRLQQLQQTLQSILAQKQQIEMELKEIEQAETELEKTTDQTPTYKTIGSLLIRTEKPKILEEFKERKELLTMRNQVVVKQEERIRKQLTDLQNKLQKELKPMYPSNT